MTNLNVVLNRYQILRSWLLRACCFQSLSSLVWSVNWQMTTNQTDRKHTPLGICLFDNQFFLKSYTTPNPDLLLRIVGRYIGQSYRMKSELRLHCNPSCTHYPIHLRAQSTLWPHEMFFFLRGVDLFPKACLPSGACGDKILCSMAEPGALGFL